MVVTDYVKALSQCVREYYEFQMGK